MTTKGIYTLVLFGQTTVRQRYALVERYDYDINGQF